MLCRLTPVDCIFVCDKVFEKGLYNTYPNIFVKYLNDNGWWIDSNLIHISPQYNFLEAQRLIPSRAACFPDHTRVAHLVGKDHAPESV